VGRGEIRTLGPTPPIFELVGHPLRWRLLRELAASDQRVRELSVAVGEPQPLVSYHLRRLRSAELVSVRRSSLDARNGYYTVDLGRYRNLLAEAGAALHPALGSPLAPLALRPRSRPVRVLFLCTGNSARSQIAEALLTNLSDRRVHSFSAGSDPKPLHPNAVRVMRKHGIDISGSKPKHLGRFTSRRLDYVISLCDRVREVCPEFAGAHTIHWSIADPGAEPGSDADTYPAFERTAVELETRIRFLLRRINDGSGSEGSRA
jgi:protein-tyrosine-phosphatase/DNA-binding transcriptional ArsR family regulator